jgi:hypothetical protein
VAFSFLRPPMTLVVSTITAAVRGRQGVELGVLGPVGGHQLGHPGTESLALIALIMRLAFWN